MARLLFAVLLLLGIQYRLFALPVLFCNRKDVCGVLDRYLFIGSEQTRALIFCFVFVVTKKLPCFLLPLSTKTQIYV